MAVFQETAMALLLNTEHLLLLCAPQTDDARTNLLTVAVLCGLSSVIGLIIFLSNRRRVFV